MVETIIITALGSTGLFTFVQFLIKRHDNKKGKMASIETKLSEIDTKLQQCEKDELRTQLLMMLSDYPTESTEIMKLAQHYFGDLHGNWYATSIFNSWLESNGKAKPEWFKTND